MRRGPSSRELGDKTGIRSKAAQYVRMSTEHQKYSTENQADTIAKYAARHGLVIVRTYEDAGKSGLRLAGRDALKRLIAEVQNGQADFGTILVYDVSRWGRFQDADESAYYEYICKEAGISVQYCAEQFENDGSLSATIIKSMKRAMAGEYSRELSAKVFAGQCRLVTLGFRQGSTPGYALRRQLIDEDNNRKALLGPGEYKNLLSDRVVLVPGPQNEVDLVRKIYRLFVFERLSEEQIADLLNRDGIANEMGRPWARQAVHQVLTNEKYIGHNVYNRRSFKLKQKRVRNPPEMWIRLEGAFDAIVEPDLFQAARRIIEERSRRLTDAQMLERLTALLSQRGELSRGIIDEVEDMPASSTYRWRFGTLLRAYQLIGYESHHYRALRAKFSGLVAGVVTKITRIGGSVTVDTNRDLLSINDEFTASIAIVPCFKTQAGALRWNIRLNTRMQADITIAVRMNATNDDIFDYYLLPRIDMCAGVLRIAEKNGIDLDAYRCDSLDQLFDLCTRQPIRGVA